MKHIEMYGKASGAKMNVEKSEIMSIGGVDLRGCDIPFNYSKPLLTLQKIMITF